MNNYFFTYFKYYKILLLFKNNLINCIKLISAKVKEKPQDLIAERTPAITFFSN